jgi:hypothetical protein
MRNSGRLCRQLWRHGPGPVAAPSGQAVTVEVRIAGEAVSFHGVAALDVWAVRADVADYCLAVVGRNWLSENLALMPVDPHEYIASLGPAAAWH